MAGIWLTMNKLYYHYIYLLKLLPNVLLGRVTIYNRDIYGPLGPTRLDLLCSFSTIHCSILKALDVSYAKSEYSMTSNLPSIEGAYCSRQL